MRRMVSALVGIVKLCKMFGANLQIIEALVVIELARARNRGLWGKGVWDASIGNVENRHAVQQSGHVEVVSGATTSVAARE